MDGNPLRARLAKWPGTPANASAEVSAEQLAVLRGVYEEHAGFIRSGLSRLAGPGVEADDLLQQVFLVALQRPDALAATSSQRAWLYGVAVKVASAARRKQRLRQFLGLEHAHELPDPSGPAEAAEAKFARERVDALLAKLSQRKRTVFILFELEGLTGPEIAQALGCPLKTVWSRLHHARAEFLSSLKREAACEARLAAAREALR